MFNNTKKIVSRKGVFLTAFVVFLNVITVEAASPQKSIKEGNLLYQKGDYRKSQQKYMEALAKDPESDIINFNVGTNLYKEEQYKEAVDHFQKVFLSEDDALKERAHYNLGNTLYKLGVSQEGDGDTAIAVSSLEKSLKQYERALSINGEDDDTKHNYAFVQKELKRLQEKQRQEQKQQSQGRNSDQSKNDQKQQQNQNQQSQNSRNQEKRENQQQQGQNRQSQNDQNQGQEDQETQQQHGQDQQDNSDQGRGHEGEEDYNKQDKTAAQSQNASKLTREEARMRLESYQQAEEPQGQLNVHQMIKDARPVARDW